MESVIADVVNAIRQFIGLIYIADIVEEKLSRLYLGVAMVQARNNVYQFTVSDITNIIAQAGLDPDDIIVSPVYKRDRFYLYLMNKYDWKTYLVLSDRNDYALVIHDTPKCYGGTTKIYFEKPEPWYVLWWKKVLKTVRVSK